MKGCLYYFMLNYRLQNCNMTSRDRLSTEILYPDFWRDILHFPVFLAVEYGLYPNSYWLSASEHLAFMDHKTPRWPLPPAFSPLPTGYGWRGGKGNDGARGEGRLDPWITSGRKATLLKRIDIRSFHEQVMILFF